jgi:hypothetical protein
VAIHVWRPKKSTGPTRPTPSISGAHRVKAAREGQWRMQATTVAKAAIGQAS